MKKKILISVGTRPEIIKTAIVIKKLLSNKKFIPIVISTGQHKTMSDDMLKLFDIMPDYRLSVMKHNQSLSYLSKIILEKTDEIINKEKPDLMMVQGDTTTAFISALSAFYNKIPIAHIEAGLRTYNKYQPYPEEINRQFIDRISDVLFAPTRQNYQNLIGENISKDKIFITGNTVIDSLKYIQEKISPSSFARPFVLITAHRRENFGVGIKNICNAIKILANKYKNYDFIYPVHKNPNIINTVNRILSDISNVKLLEPLSYMDFVNYLTKAKLVLTDSGGVQEEAVGLGIPTLVMRNLTERTEGIEVDILKLVGTDTDKIVRETEKFLNSNRIYQNSSDIYGTGDASDKIIAILEDNFPNV